MKHRLLLACCAACGSAIAEELPQVLPAVPPRVAGERPVVLGHGVGLFKIGPLLARDDFEDLENWVVQIEKKAGEEPARVTARKNSLDCFLPGCGATAWFNKKFSTRITITYEVLCPTHQPAIKGLLPRDINNFWMASDPVDPEAGLFDSSRYDGGFGSYSKMHGYYASTGGRRNTTTRMRRYPREIDGEPADHLALNDKDEKPDYLITPNQVIAVQLVAYDDVIQYLVDDKLVYEIAQGDRVQTEGRDHRGKTVAHQTTYDLSRFPVYEEGYFGFRLVGTHHVYTKFRAYALEPALANDR